MLKFKVGPYQLSGRSVRELAKKILEKEPSFGSFVGFGELVRQLYFVLEKGKGKVGGFPEYGSGSWFYDALVEGGEEEKENLYFNSHGDPYIKMKDGEQCESSWGTSFGTLRLATPQEAAQFGIILPFSAKGESPWRQAMNTGNMFHDPEGLEMDYLPRPHNPNGVLP